MVNFVIESEYTRKDVYAALGLPLSIKGGNWETGSNRFGNDWYLFCFVGNDQANEYQNKFINDELHWFGKLQTKLHNESIQSMIFPAGKIHIFYREHKRQPFIYAGEANPVSWNDTSPVKIVWRFFQYPEEDNHPDKVVNYSTYHEGALRQIYINAYERDRNARNDCLKHYGYKCCVCDFDFEKTYGEIGKKYIHVHHLKPLSEIKEEYEIDPINDLRPICPNCHAMVHRFRTAISIEDLRKSLRG